METSPRQPRAVVNDIQLLYIILLVSLNSSHIIAIENLLPIVLTTSFTRGYHLAWTEWVSVPKQAAATVQ